MIAARRSHPPSSAGYTMQLLGILGWSSRGFLQHIPHETLVICGDDDPLVPVANGEMLARLIPRAQLEVVERGGHLLLWDDAKNVVAAHQAVPELGDHRPHGPPTHEPAAHDGRGRGGRVPVGLGRLPASGFRLMRDRCGRARLPAWRRQRTPSARSASGSRPSSRARGLGRDTRAGADASP